MIDRYRQAALKVVAEHLIGPKRRADETLDTLVREVRGLPPRPDGAPVYERLFAHLTPEPISHEALTKLTNPRTASEWIRPLNIALEPTGWKTPVITHFLAQILHETRGLQQLEESLWYSRGRILQVFGHRILPAEAEHFAGNPAALAERVYGGRLGNRPEGSGDGWAFRGRGPIMLTGRGNYGRAARATGLPLLEHPEMAAKPVEGTAIAVWFFQASSAAATAAAGGTVRDVTLKINGGTNGLPDRERWHQEVSRLML